MSRLDNLPEQKLITEVQRLRSDLDEIRNRQAISGLSGILSYLTIRPATYDYIRNVGADTDTTAITQSWKISWAGGFGQSFPVAHINFQLFVNGTDVAHQLTPQTPTWTDGTRSVTVTYQGRGVVGGLWSFFFTVQSLKAVTIRIKMAAYASSPGALGLFVNGSQVTLL